MAAAEPERSAAATASSASLTCLVVPLLPEQGVASQASASACSRLSGSTRGELHDSLERGARDDRLVSPRLNAIIATRAVSSARPERVAFGGDEVTCRADQSVAVLRRARPMCRRAPARSSSRAWPTGSAASAPTSHRSAARASRSAASRGAPSFSARSAPRSRARTRRRLRLPVHGGARGRPAGAARRHRRRRATPGEPAHAAWTGPASPGR